MNANNFNGYFYKQGGGVTFYNPDTDEKICHTYEDAGLVLLDVYPSPPVPKTNFIDIPGRDGSIDLTEALGGVRFEDRYLYIELLDRDYKLSVGAAFTRLQRLIDGRRVKVILDKMPSYYYVGRVIEFSEPDEEGLTATSTVTVEIEPYRYSIYSADEPWLWDPFNFYTDMAIDAGSFKVSGTLRKVIYVGMNDVTPTITVDSAMTLEYEGKTYQLEPGATMNYDIRFRGNKENVLVIKGNGTITIDYRGGQF